VIIPRHYDLKGVSKSDRKLDGLGGDRRVHDLLINPYYSEIMILFQPQQYVACSRKGTRIREEL